MGAGLSVFAAEKKKPVQQWRKVAALTIFTSNIALLMLVFSMVQNDLTFKFEIWDAIALRAMLIAMTPASLFVSMGLVISGWERKLCLVLFIICLPVGLLVCGLIGLVNHTDYYYFSNDRRVDSIWGDQGALGTGPLAIAVNKGWGPIFYKRQCLSIEKAPTIGKEINGKVQLRYSTDGIEKVRDLDNLLSGKERLDGSP